MNVTVQLIGTFQIGRFKEEVRQYPPGTPVQQLVEELQIPAPLLGVVLINGIHSHVGYLLGDGDTVCFLPFIDGG